MVFLDWIPEIEYCVLMFSTKTYLSLLKYLLAVLGE